MKQDEDKEKWNNLCFCSENDEEGVVVAGIIAGAAFIGIMLILIYGWFCLE